MSYGSLEIKDVESCEEDGGPACEVSKGSSKALHIRVIFYTEFRVCHCGQLGLIESATINKMPAPMK